MTQIVTRTRRHWAFALILAGFLGLAVTYSIVNPLFESPDEVWHYEYVRWLGEGHGLPEPEDVGHAPWHQEGSQPPLYYLSAAALTWWIPTDNAPAVIRYNPHGAIGQAAAPDNRNMMAHGPAEAWPWRGTALAAHAARLYSVLLGGLTVLFTYLISLRAFPERRWTAVLAATLVAFNPQFIFISAAVNNDNLVTTASAAGLWLLVVVLTTGAPVQRAGRKPGRRWQQAAPSTAQVVALGALAGVAALSKLSGLLFAPFVGLVLAIVAWRLRSWTALLRWGLLAGGAFVVVAGWWYVRNWLLFRDPLLLTAMFAILPRRPEPPTLAELLARGQGVWRSYWAVFGWFNVVVAPWLYQAFTGLTLAGLGGLALGPLLHRVYRRGDDDAAPASPRWLTLLVLGIWAGLVLLLLIRWATMRYPQGRLLFPAISALSVLLAYGLTNWLPARLHGLLTGVITVAMFATAALIPVRTIAPVYAAPAPLAAGATTPNRLDGVHFGDQLALRGFAIGAEEVIPGQALPIDLYWEALTPPARDYSIFIHLTDEDQILQAQRDSYPGGGNAPTSDWPAGVVMPDHHLVAIPATAPAPARLRIDVGVYDYATGERLLVDGQDHWTIGYLALLPAPGDSGFPHPVRINFDDKMALIGFEFDKRVVAPGEVLGVTLWWEALAEMEIDYKVFVHYVLPPESTWAQKDDDPQDGAAPTTGWEVGQVVEDPYRIALPAEAPPGVYFVEIGVYDKATNDRLKVNFSDNGIVLGQFRVETPD